VDILNNRQLALVFWFVLLAIFTNFSPKMNEVRRSISGVIQAFFQKQIIYFFVLMIFYVSIEVYYLHQAGLWKFHQLVNTIIWVAFVGFGTFLKLEKIKTENGFFRSAVLNSFKIAAYLEFFIGLYTYDLYIEIIILPFIFMLSATWFYCEEKEEYTAVYNVLTFCMVVVFIALISNSASGLFFNIDDVSTEKTIFDFFTPPLLTLFYTPFIFITFIYYMYELAFLKISWAVSNPYVRAFAKVMPVIVFNVNAKSLEKWAGLLVNDDISTFSGVIRSFFKYYKIRRINNNTEYKTTDGGWSPNLAKNFLGVEELGTRDYRPLFENEWSASSPMQDFGTGLPSSNIAYYIEGDELSVKALKVKININNTEDAKEANDLLISAAHTLYKNALESDLPLSVEEFMEKELPQVFPNGNVIVSIQKEEWLNENYDLKFVISKK
jgi:hypothetical protein